jgi:DNA polymerase-3 subunit gamma/tau
MASQRADDGTTAAGGTSGEPGLPGVAATAEPYRVVARRYRPQRFDELVGQEHVARGLGGAIASGRVGHAYLFTGARGVGKTSAARIFAKALACAAGPASEPCNACDACAAISAGSDVDVVEIDAASNRGIDEIRSLRQNVAVRPARGRFKVYIVDEVHMLTREAFNALLKTLEEPPAHVKFVLCTTEPEKLPITILSRCQRFDFLTVDTDAIHRRLVQIVAAESVEAEDGALRLIAARAAGSMRDSQSLLEQLLGCCEGTIRVEDVHRLLGTGRAEAIGRLVAAVAARDAAAALTALDEAVTSGADPGGVLEQLLAALRDALVASVGVADRLLGQGSPGGVDLAALGRELGTDTILAMLQIVDQSLFRMRSSVHAAVIAEMAVVRLAGLENLQAIADAIERLEGSSSEGPARGARPPSGAGGGGGGGVGPTRPAPGRTPPVGGTPRDGGRGGPPAAETTGHGQKKNAPTGEAVVDDRATGGDRREELSGWAGRGPSDAAAAGAGTDPPGSGSMDAADPRRLWIAAAEAVGGLAADFAAIAARVGWKADDILEVELPPTGAAAASFLERPETASALREALSALAGRPVRQQVRWSAPAAGEAAGAREKHRSAGSQAALVHEAHEHPLVAHARMVFDATVRKVEPGSAPTSPDSVGAE